MGTEKGYVIAVCDGSDYYIPDALHIERNDNHVPWVYKDDKEAARGAEQDGTKLIYGMDGIDDGVYIDTPENRLVITEALKQKSAYVNDPVQQRENEKRLRRVIKSCMDNEIPDLIASRVQQEMMSMENS